MSCLRYCHPLRGNFDRVAGNSFPAAESRWSTVRFDMIVAGGRVIDPSRGMDEVCDVGVVGNRITAVDRLPRAAARQVLDAEGLLVVPGLIDLHTHLYAGTHFGLDPDAYALKSGATTLVDAGSAGASTITNFRRFLADPAVPRVLAFLHLSRIGLAAGGQELANPFHVDVDACVAAAQEHSGFVVGVKVRMGGNTGSHLVGDGNLVALVLAKKAARAVGLPLMVHISTAPPAVDHILDMLDSGDILTHAFTGKSMCVLNEYGEITPAWRRARDRGVHIDAGHGVNSFSFRVAERLVAAGEFPDAISSDGHVQSVTGSMEDLPTCMTKFLALGMTLTDVIAAATTRPAHILGLSNELGSLRPGACADITVLRMDEGHFSLIDAEGQSRTGRNRLRVVTVVRGGQIYPADDEFRATTDLEA